MFWYRYGRAFRDVLANANNLRGGCRLYDVEFENEG